MANDKTRVTRVWRAIKDVDIDSNGFLHVDELEACFREHFSYALDGKSLVYFFRRYSTDHDKDLINYKLIKTLIVEGIRESGTDYKDTPVSEVKSMTKSITTANLHEAVGLK